MIIYVHLAVIAIVSALWYEAWENKLFKLIFGFSLLASTLAAYIYAIYSLLCFK